MPEDVIYLQSWLKLLTLVFTSANKMVLSSLLAKDFIGLFFQ